tara:strand:+ start:49299 stop:49802 length:504 start_codon:yes stop_codon:yes gene_type:complete
MKILITPHDIIERALWYKYQNLILDGINQEEIDKIITENEEFEINERDALVINLIKCIDTNNLKHRLNQHILHLLSVRSTDVDNGVKKVLCITKKTIEYELTTFLKNFPPAWEPRLNYKEGLRECNEYVSELKGLLEDLLVIIAEIKGNKVDYIQVTHVKKMLTFNH